jgi:Ca-activated chloride channel family protein
MLPSDFHFLRPFWFLALLPALLLFWSLWSSRLRAGHWSLAINNNLLPHLLDSRTGARRRWPLFLALAAWLLASLSLAGPVWRKLPQAVQQKQDTLVIIQDLSLSFYAQDLAPNRLTRARHKLIDLLNARKEGVTALIVYAGDAHVVCPLTDDTATIAAMVPDLEPGIMPSYGSNLEAAVELALKLLADSSVSHGRLLLLTDEVAADDGAAVANLLGGKDVSLSVLGVGTAAGGPIPKGDGTFLQDDHGSIVIPRLASGDLRKLATDNSGRYCDITLDDGDFNYLLGAGASMPRNDEYRQVKREFDQWREEGYWLLLPIMALALLGFRRGWLIFILVMAVLTPAGPSAALEWRDLWLRKDQQAARALADNQPQQAAELFKNPQWKGAAEYRAGNYAGALESFAKTESGDGYYNRGNGLAKLGRFEEAVQAYEQALKINPELADARANKQLVEQLLKRQQQPNPQDKQEKSGQGQNKQGQGQPEKSEQGQNRPGQGNQEKSGPGQGQNQERQDQAKQSGQAGKQSQPGLQKNGAQGGAGQQNNKSQAGAAPGHNQEQGGSGRPEEKGLTGDERKIAEGKAGEKNSPGKQPSVAAVAEADKLTPEQRQAQEQLLGQVPDNPGGLLRRKFQYQNQNNRQRGSGTNRKIW